MRILNVERIFSDAQTETLPMNSIELSRYVQVVRSN